MFLRIVSSLLLFSTTLVCAVQNVKVQGSNFVNNVTNNRFQIIGVAFVIVLHPGNAKDTEDYTDTNLEAPKRLGWALTR